MIITYTTDDAAAPEDMRAVASFLPDGKPTPTWTAHGPTSEAARAKLQAFLDAERAKVENVAKRGAHLRKTGVEEIGDVL